jgi:hypothetical protein
MVAATIERAATPPYSVGVEEEATPYRWQVYAACTALTIVLNYAFGKEMAWDLLHYHFYAGFSALSDRFDLDYFAAGPNSYFNPYAYIPFYLLVKLGLPGLAVGTVLATFHSVVLWLTYELACSVSPSKDRKGRFFFGLCATTLALMNPVFLQQLGSSFSDITTTGFVLGGWLLLVRAVLRPSTKLVVFAAILLGIATALKPTNGLYAASAIFLVAFLPLPLVGRIRNLFLFCTTSGLSFLLTDAPWAYRLAQVFGNPVFPLMNGIFKSPQISVASAKHHRFIPDSLTDALLRPFEMMGTNSMVTEELQAPDLRYALLLVVFLISVIAWTWRLRRPPAILPESSASKSGTRVLTALGIGFSFSWIMWLNNSGNSRYFLPMASVAAVLAIALLFRLLADYPVGRNALLLTLLVAQGAQLALGTEYRWNEAPWNGNWFNVEIPPTLAAQPNLYLSIGMQSNSFIVPFLAKGSGIVNFAGGYALGPDGVNAARVRAMVARSAPNLRVLVGGTQIYADSALSTPRQSDVDDLLSTFGLRLDMSDCETITVQGLRPMVWWPRESSTPAPMAPSGKLKYTFHLASCHLVPDTRDRSQEIAARRAIDVVLNRLEDACPALFQPGRTQTEHINGVWLRVYSATDLSAWVSQGQVKFASATSGPAENLVGREDEWARGSLRLECGRRNGIYFARIARPSP